MANLIFLPLNGLHFVGGFFGLIMTFTIVARLNGQLSRKEYFENLAASPTLTFATGVGAFCGGALLASFALSSLLEGPKYVATVVALGLGLWWVFTGALCIMLPRSTPAKITAVLGTTRKPDLIGLVVGLYLLTASIASFLLVYFVDRHFY